MAEYTYTKQRIHFAGGAWADVSVARFPASALHFEDIVSDDFRVRMRDAGHFRYYKARARGETNPLIVTWACLEADRPAAQVFPGVETTTDEGEHLLSANSLVTYTLRTLLARGWLRWQEGTWQARVPPNLPHWRERAGAVLNWLTAGGRLWLEAGSGGKPPARAAFEGFRPLLNLIPVGHGGFARDVVRERMPRVVFNAAYFLLEHDDFVSHHSALGDPYGLMVHDGAIVRPPLYRRGAIWREPGGRWQVGRIGMADVRLILPDGTRLSPQDIPANGGPRFCVNPVDETEVALYTRYLGVPPQGRVLGRTPSAPDRRELTIVDRRVVGWKRDGDVLIPQNGFVLSFAAKALPEGRLRAMLGGGRVEYAFVRGEQQGVDRALQSGPLLIREGRSVLSPATLSEEQYWISRKGEGGPIVGVVPTDFPEDINLTRAARIGLGVDAKGDLLALAVDGVNKGMAIAKVDSAGVTLVELAEQLLAAGAVEAINLDGGGSTQLFVEGGLLTRPADRRGRPGFVYERMVPSIGIAP